MRGYQLPGFETHLTSIRRESTTPHNSDDSTAQTIERMNSHIRRSVSNPYVRAAAGEVLRAAGGPHASDYDKATAAWRWVKQRVTFATDEALVKAALKLAPDKELLIEPARLLTMPRPMGDCDDFSMLLCSILLALGVHCELVTVAADGSQPERWSHVYVAALVDGKRLPLDASHGLRPGWETGKAYRKRRWAVDYSGPSGLHGIEQATVRRPVRSRVTANEGQVLAGKLRTRDRGQARRAPRADQLALLDSQVLGGRPAAIKTNGMQGLGFAQASGTPMDWGSVLRQGATTAFDVFRTRFSFQPGTFVQETPQGTTVFRQQTASPFSSFQFPTSAFGPEIPGGGGGIGLWVIGGGVLLLSLALLKG